MYVLMVVSSDFPEGDAGSVRDLAFSKIYQDLGYKVFLIGMGKKSDKGEYDNVNFYSVHSKKANIFQKIFSYLKYKKNCIRIINKIIARNGDLPNIIHINDIWGSLINYLIKLSKNNSIPILHDSTEWYSKCEFKIGIFDKAYILKNYTNKKKIRKPIKVIAISTYLENHFKSRGLNTVCIPVIMDVKKINFVKRPKNELLQLIYAGSPANKDCLKEMIKSIMLLSPREHNKLVFNIYGIEKNQIEEKFSIKNIPECIKIHGRIPRNRILDILPKMDFSLLLRPENERYTKAGFPTKVVESMAYGIPMICNLTSDLELYLKDGINSILVQNCSSDDFVIALRKVLRMDRNEILKLKINARKMAKSSFEYSEYIDEVKQLIET